MTETLANGYSSLSALRELSNEYQDDRVSMVFQESCSLVPWTKVVSALEGLMCAQSLCYLLLPNCPTGHSLRGKGNIIPCGNAIPYPHWGKVPLVPDRLKISDTRMTSGQH